MTLPLRGRIARTSVLNLAAAAAPAILGIILLPTITRGLGIERFGLLSLALATLEYASVFALGLGPATVKYVAEEVARGGGAALGLVRWSALAQLALGLAAAGVLALLAPTLATRVFRLSGAFAADATAAFRLVGLLLPVTLLLGTLLGAMEGAARFDYSNGLRAPLASATFVVPAIVVGFSRSVALIIGIILLVRVFFAGLAWMLLRRLLSHADEPPAQGAIRRLFSFGAWVSLSNLLNPVLVYGERYLLGIRGGMAAIGFYAAPLDALLRVLIVPGSLGRALFPTLSVAGARGDSAELRRLSLAAVRWLTLLVGPPLIGVALFAPALLDLWLGAEFAVEAGMATRILAVGVLLNALAQVPSNVLTATGRPHLPARFHAAEAVAYVPLAWWLIGQFGIVGAAVAWSARVVVDTVLLFAASWRVFRATQPRVAS